jgi:uncharacterized membrane protein
MDRPFYPPVVLPFFFLLLISGFLFFVIFASAVNSVFVSLGLPSWIAYPLLLVSFIGSFVNIPLKDVSVEEEEVRYESNPFFGMLYPVRKIERMTRKTTIAINVGGAVIPMILSAYVLLQNVYGLPAFLLATLFTVSVCHAFARIVPGVGIVMPNFIPPISACILAIFSTLLFNCFELAPFVAYFSGVIGTLIGADIMNLKKVSRIHAKMLSIGGAGTFDGIFITGIFSVILTAIFV